MANTVNVIIKADDQASREIDNVASSTGKLGTVMQGVGTIAAGFLAANVLDAGFRALTDGVNNAIAGWKEHLQVASQTEAAIASTGAAAGLTAQQVEDLANQFKATSLFEDDVIQTGENLLLTFTNIGADVFPRATQAMLDMSQRMGQDVSTSAIQLGKALNDPIAGVTSLRRVGVQLNEQQEAQIQAMVEAGNVAGAQAVILAELEKEFGGSAQAASDAAGAAATYDDRMDDLNDTIGEKLLPVQLKFKEAQLEVINVILGQAIPAIDTFIQEHQKLFDSVSTVIEGISAAWPTLVPVFEAVGASIAAVAEGIATTLEGTVQMVQGTVDLISAIVHGDWQGAWDAVGTIVGGAAQVVLGGLETMNAGALGLFSTFKDDAIGIWNGFSDAIGGIADGLVSRVVGAFQGMVSTVRGIFNSLIDGINGVISRINSALSFSITIPGVDLPGPLPDIPSTSFSFNAPDIPTVPRLARGGIVRRPTLALIGEAGPEAVMPLTGAERNVTVNLQVQGSIHSERDLVRIIRNEFLNGGLHDVFNSLGLVPSST